MIRYAGKQYTRPWEHTGTVVNGRETEQRAFCHMFDSIEDIGGDTTGLTRP
jgi:hypothetical protein